MFYWQCKKTMRSILDKSKCKSTVSIRLILNRTQSLKVTISVSVPFILTERHITTFVKIACVPVSSAIFTYHKEGLSTRRNRQFHRYISYSHQLLECSFLQLNIRCHYKNTLKYTNNVAFIKQSVCQCWIKYITVSYTPQTAYMGS